MAKPDSPQAAGDKVVTGATSSGPPASRATLDKSKPYGIVSGVSRAAFEQDNKMFGPDEQEITTAEFEAFEKQQAAA